MVSAVNHQTISFAAHWDSSNSSLQDTLANKVSKVCLYLLHRLAIKAALPATGISKERVLQSKADFIRDVNQSDFERKPIEITTPDGVKLRGTFLQTHGCDMNAPVVIFANPNAMLHTQGGFCDAVNYAQEKGKKCNFILFDYRECGESEGKAIMAKDLVIDGESIYQFARDELQIEPKNIHMMGWSFGGSVTARVKALHPECTGNYVNDRSFIGIIETTYELLGKGIFAKIASVLLRFLGWEALNAGNALAHVQGKTLISYHPRDRVIRDTAQLARSPNVTRDNIETLELQGQDDVIDESGILRSDGDDIQNYHGHPLSLITQDNGRKAIEEVAEVLFYGIPTTTQVQQSVDSQQSVPEAPINHGQDARRPSTMDIDEEELIVPMDID